MLPRIICHGFSSVDGRIVPARWTPVVVGTRPNIVSITDRQAVATLQADGTIVGASAVHGVPGLQLGDPSLSVARMLPSHFVRRLDRPLCLVYDRQARVRFRTNRLGEGQIIAVVPRTASDAYLEQARLARVSYVFAGEEGRDLAAAIQQVKDEVGCSLLLLRGDGETNSRFMRAGLVDQVSVLLFPGLDARSGESSLFESVHGDTESPATGRSLLHVSTQTLDGGIVWLRYLVETAVAA